MYIHARFNNVILKSLSLHNSTSSSTSHTVHHTLISYQSLQYTTRAISNTPDLPTLQLGATTLGLRIKLKNIISHVLELQL
jgi:hypothetical protein